VGGEGVGGGRGVFGGVYCLLEGSSCWRELVGGGGWL